MHLERMTLTALLTLVATLTISDFPLIPNPKSQIQNSWALAQTPDARKAEADRLLQQATEQVHNGQLSASLQSYQQVLTIYRELRDQRREAATLAAIGSVYAAQGEIPRAIEFLQQSLEIARKLNDRQLEEIALQGLSLAKRQSDPRTAEADRLNRQGIEQEQTGQFEAALQSWQQALFIYREIKDRQNEAETLGKLAGVYDSQGVYSKAIEYYQQYLAIARENHNRQAEGQVLTNLGLAYGSLGDKAKAIEYFQQVLAIGKAIKDRDIEGGSLGNLGLAYLYQDNYKAIEYFEQVLAIARETKNRPSEAKALVNLGTAYYDLGDYAKAIDYQQQLLALAKGDKDPTGELYALGNLGLVSSALGDNTKAIEYYQRVLAIAREIKYRDLEGQALKNLGSILYKEGKLAAAETTLFDGIKILESLRNPIGSNDADKVAIFNKQVSIYNILQKVLIAQNKTDAALEIAERGRARAFVELLAKRLAPSRTEQATIPPPNIEQIQQIAKTQNSTLVQYSIIYDEFKVQGKQQDKESKLYIWVIKPTGEVTFRSSDLKPLWQQQNTTLADLVFNSRDSIGVRGLPIIGVVPRPGTQQKQEASLTQQLQQLHKLLIEPIADQLPTDPNEHVIFIPQGELFLAPFVAFQDKDGKYLIEKHTILSAPSIQVLQLIRQQQQSRGSGEWGVGSRESLVVGNPTMPSVPPAFGEKPQQLPPLPGAEKEAEAIAPLLKTNAIIGKDATKSAIEQLMPKARIIHLATHGLLDDVRGIGSAIALAPSGNDDGLLTAEEILNLKLNAQLVVLSACNTGRGRITGDGVIGLSRALISAGVPSVLVSLWSVPDAPTASLMTEFYQNLLHTPDKAQALRQAMLTTMKQHPNPRDWAAFTLIGEAN